MLLRYFRQGFALLTRLLVPGLLLTALPVHALPPGDARSIAMAGTGVASADALGAPLHNPALLAIQPESTGWGILMPYLGVSGAIGEQLMDDILDIADNDLLNDLSNTIDRYNLAQSNGLSNAEINRLAGDIIGSAEQLDAQLSRLNREAIRTDITGALAFSRPNRDLGYAIHQTLRIKALAVMDYRDQQTLRDYIALAQFIQANPNNVPALNPLSTELTSTGRLLGLASAETGISLAAQGLITAYPQVALGITPKWVQLVSFDYQDEIDDFSLNNFNLSDHDNSTGGLNLDFGAAYQWGDAQQWTIAGTLTNVLSQTLRTPTGHQFKVRPEARVALAYEGGWYRWSTDLDLLPVQPLNLEGDTLFLSAGAELSPWSWIVVRAGLRLNIGSDTQADKSLANGSVFTTGLGIDLWGLRWDLSALIGESAIGAGLQLSYLQR